MIAIDELWSRIESCEGEEFILIKGGTFSYKVSEGHVKLDRTNQRIPRSHFGKALEMVPLENTVLLQKLRGPSFIYSILMDSRIRKKDW